MQNGREEPRQARNLKTNPRILRRAKISLVHINNRYYNMIYCKCKIIFEFREEKIMKKKLLLLTVLVMILACLLAVSVSAEVTTYDDAPANEKLTASISDVVVFDDGFTCPSVYIFKSTDTVAAGDHTGKNGLQSSVDFSYINGKTGKAYDVSKIVELDIPEGITTLSGYGFTRLEIERISIPKTVTSIGGCCFEKCLALEECVFEHTAESSLTSLPSWVFQGCTSLKAFCFPECITAINAEYEFSGCTNLTAVYLPKNLTAYNTPGNDQKSAFWSCKKMYFVSEPFTYDNIPEKPAIYYMPSGLTSVSGELFKKCENLNETLVFPVGLTAITNSYSFTTDSSTVKNVVFLGDMTSLNTSNWKLADGAKILFANANDTDSSSLSSLSGSHTKIYCASETDLSKHVAEKTSIIDATCITDQFVTSYCFCGKLIKNEAVADTATGVHIWETNDCTVSVQCKTCTEMSDANADHNITRTLEYANGFGKNGVYNCICENAEYCTVIEGYALNETKNPIITFKGYSVPEKETKLAINVGYEIDYTLLNEYEKLTGEEVKLSLFMVNSQTKDNEQNKVNISAIFKNEALDFADGVKGFCVQVNKSSYNSISLTIKGFDKGENYDGSYYALKLISAIVVQTTKDAAVTSTHYVQATLDTTDKITLDNFDFVIITASAVYKDPIPTTQE